MYRNTLRSLLAAAAASGALCTAGPAAASSIVYVKSGNVYLTSPDDASGYEVTTGGGWSSPSQADDGTIVAVHGQNIVRLDRSGHVLSSFPVVGGSANGAMSGATSLAGPYDAEVSPDGSQVAYWDMGDLITPSPECGQSCANEGYSDVVSVTSADHFTMNGYDDDSAEHPHWIGNTDQLVFTDSFVNPQARLWRPGSDGSQQLDGAEQQWFGDPPQYLGAQSYFFANTVPSRDGSKVAVVASANGGAGPYDHLLLYSTPAPVGSSAPTPQCSEQESAGLNDISWSPDGSAITFDDPAGIEVLSIPSTTLSGCAGFAPHRLLIARGAQPSWGPADVDMRQAPSAPATTPTPAPKPKPKPKPRPVSHHRTKHKHQTAKHVHHARQHHTKPRPHKRTTSHHR